MTRPIVSADRFSPSATQLNRWEQAGQRAANLPDGGIRDERPGQSANEAIVKNTTGSTLPRFSVLQTTEPLVSPSSDSDRYKSQVAFLGKLVEEDDEQRFAITQTRLEANDVDPFAIVAGVTHIRLTGPSGKTHATTVEGESALEASDSGPCVILHDPGPEDEERIARVRIGGGGKSDPPCTHVLKILVMGNPSSGALQIPLNVNGTTQTISITMPATLAAIKTAFEGHSALGAGTVFTSTTHTGGLPHNEIGVYFKKLDDEGELVDVPWSVANYTSTMTGGPHAAYAVLSTCCS